MEKSKVLYHIVPPLFLAVILFALAAISFYQRQLSRKQEKIFVTNHTTRKTRFFHAAYVFLSTFPLTRHHIRKIRERYEIVEPGEIKKTENETVKTALCIWGLSFGVFLIGVWIDLSVYTILICAILAYVISSNVLFAATQRKERKLNEQIVQFINDTEHAYYATNMIESAIDDTVVKAPEPIRTHMQKISQILDSSDMAEETTSYIDNTSNPFLRLYLSACELVNEYDDKLVHGYSLFVSNLNLIKTSIATWLRTQKKLNESFKFLGFMILAPMCFVKIIDNVMISQFSETAHYYEGSFGIIMSSVICFASVLLYSVVDKMKNLEFKDTGDHILLEYISGLPVVKGLLDNWEDKHYGKVLKTNNILRRTGSHMTARLLQIEKFFSMLGMFLLSVMICFSMVQANRRLTLTDTDQLEANLNYIITDEEELESCLQYSTDLVKAYLHEEVTLEMIEKQILRNGTIQNSDVVKLLAEDVTGRVQGYQNIYFKWWYLVICMVLAVFGYQLPILIIDSRKHMLEMAQANEVIQFQSIISMLMYIDAMSPEVILDWMCRFSNIFRPSLMKCQARYNAGDTDALEQLIEDEPYIPFQRIIESLIDSDRVGIKNAFVELEGEREAEKKKRELDTDIYISDKATAASLLSFIPILLVIIGYLVVPIMFTANGGLIGLNTTLK